MPPPSPLPTTLVLAELPERVQLLIVSLLPKVQAMPPPNVVLELPESVELVSDRVPWLQMPPPSPPLPAELLENVLLLTLTGRLEIGPAQLPGSPLR